MENPFSSALARSRKFFADKNPAVLAGAGLAAILLLFVLTAGHKATRQLEGAKPTSPNSAAINSEASTPDAFRAMPDFSPSAAPKTSSGLILKSLQPQSLQPYREPHIAYSAELSVVTKEFARSRSTLEEILDRHRGYVAKLRNAGASGLSDALDTISTILVFLAGRSPLLALWAVLLYLPVRFFWRRRSQLAFNQASAPKNQ